MFERIAFYTTITVIGGIIGYTTGLVSAEIAFIVSAMIARQL